MDREDARFRLKIAERFLEESKQDAVEVAIEAVHLAHTLIDELLP
jgi:hypothetical protein